MKLIKTAVPLLLFFHFSFYAFSQKTQTMQFEKCKGKLPFPVCTIYGSSDLKHHKEKQVVPGFMNLSFITDSAAEVKAIYAGTVSKIFTVEDGYAVVTNFGDYYITYYPLANPGVKKGDVVLSGQPISTVSISEGVPEVNILLSKATTFIDPYKWFKW